MDHLAQNFKVVPIITPQSVTSVAAGDVINMSEYDKVTFIIETGTVTVGSGISVRQMDAVGDTVASESRLSVDYYWEQAGAASDTYTKTSADSLSSAGGITVANGDDSRVYIMEVKGVQLAEGNNCVSLYVDSSAANMLMSAIAVCQPRYAQASPPSALA